MRRREFLFVLGVGAAWPVATGAQQLPVIGFLGSTSASEWAHLVFAFREGLRSGGLGDGENFVMEYRWAEGQIERLHALAADLVGRRVSVIVATGGSVSAITAKSATATIPVVFVIGADPIRLGLVASLNQPGGNITGVSFVLNALVSKRLELIRQLVPTATKIGVLVNPRNPNLTSDITELEAAARSLGLHVHVVKASSESDLVPAFGSLQKETVAALLVFPDPFFASWRDQIVALAALYRVPTAYPVREFAAAGGLMSYGTSVSEAHRHAGTYVRRILRGESPADLPVIQSSQFEFVLNATAARALGLAIPPTLLARADEVIE